ncbi:hypothetical protein LLG96_07110 [bacterium]|nr:hypothetical protein [bacterium]
MKRIILVIYILGTAAAALISAQDTGKTPDKAHAIIGSWERRGFYYTFDDSASMRSVRIVSDPIGYREYRYSTFNIQVNTFIEFRENGSEKKERNFLLLDDVTDTTAVIAFGTPFIRADSSKGLTGAWKRIEDMKTMLWTIRGDSVYFMVSMYDPDSRKYVTLENRSGSFVREPQSINVYTKAESGGRFHVHYDNGRSGLLLPVIYDDVLYVFDLTPGKADFVRVDSASVPTRRDYEAELAKRKAIGNK